MRKKPLVVAALSGVLLITGCGLLPNPAPSDSETPTATASETPSAEPTNTEPSTPPVTAGATVVGTCTAAGITPIPAIYVAYTDDATTPITLSYPAFNADGSVSVLTETVTGPVVTRVSYPCTPEASGTIWNLSVTAGGARIGCALSFGGQFIDAVSEGDGGATPATASCTGNPGV